MHIINLRLVEIVFQHFFGQDDAKEFSRTANCSGGPRS